MPADDTPERIPRAAGHIYPADRAEAANEEEVGGRPAFLFAAGDMAGVTLDPSGTNLPAPPRNTRWTLQRRFTLGVRDAGLGSVSPEPLIRGILASGCYVWRTDAAIGGRGTSQ